MKIHVFVAILLAAIVAVIAAPSPISEVGKEYMPLDDIQVGPERAKRDRSMTCNLLGVGRFGADSACSARCIRMGNAYGRCNSGICQCWPYFWGEH